MAVRNRVVLIIDDDEELRYLLRRILEGSGMLVVEAENVEQAVKSIENSVPHLIITDLNMQPESGFHFLEKKRRHPIGKNLPAIVLSARSDKEAVMTSLALGASDYLLKPLNATMVLQKTRKILKDKSFRTYTFPEEVRPVIGTKLQGQIARMGEVGFILEAPVKIGSETTVKGECEVFEELGMKDVPLRTTRLPGRLSGERGLYYNNITLVGVNESIASKIRKKVKQWGG